MPTGYKLSKTSADRLEGVHPLLVAVVIVAMRHFSTIDFGVAKDSVRTIKTQQAMVDRGVSKTMKSYHLIHDDGYSHAVDLYPSGYKRIEDITSTAWHQLSVAMNLAAELIGVKITWGGDWKSFVDKPHFQIEI